MRSESRINELKKFSRIKVQMGVVALKMPTFEDCMRPVLEVLAQESPLPVSALNERVADALGLSQEQRLMRIPSGTSTMISHRAGWARTCLGKAGLAERVARGLWQITAAGRDALRMHSGQIAVATLRTYEEYERWHQRAVQLRGERGKSDSSDTVGVPGGGGSQSAATPEDLIRQSSAQLRRVIADQLLEHMAEMSPARFELLVVQLIIKLGYGSSADEVEGALTGGPGDGGVDGVISEDRLGLGQIYLQAKRWKDRVGRPLIQAFVGAMHGRTQRGVFIATSEFSDEAREYAQSLSGIRLRLIGGQELAELMIECGLGVTEQQVFRTYKVDSDFFVEAEY